MNISTAARKALREWNRCRISIVGEGRAGKTALSRSLEGKAFEQTTSTIGVSRFTCEVKHVAVGASGAWQSVARPEKELENALADMVTERQHEASSVSGSMLSSPASALSKVIISQPTKSPHKGQGIVQNQVSNYTPVAREVSGYNFDLVAKMVEKKRMTSSTTKLIFYINDFGGQEVFNTIYHYYITNNGIYIIVFNMEDLLCVAEDIRSINSLRIVRFWLNVIVAYAPDARIALVGTRKDTVGSEYNARINDLLFHEFKEHLAWSRLIMDPSGVTAKGNTQLCFFPIDNTLGTRDGTLSSLMSCIEGAAVELSSTAQMIPLTWMKAIDALLAGTKSFLPFAEATAIIQSCDIPTCDVEALLLHLHDTGFVMWHNEPILKEVVITNPIEYYINAVATLICKHLPSDRIDGDPTFHFNETHRLAMNRYPDDWRRLMDTGVVSSPLLHSLLEGCTDRLDIVIKMMEKQAILAPKEYINDNWGLLYNNANPNSNTGAPSLSSVDYFVPSLFPPSIGSPDRTMLCQPVYFGDNSCVCLLAFTVSDVLNDRTIFTMDELRLQGLMLPGLFQRLTCMGISFSMQTVAIQTMRDMELFSDVVVFRFGNQHLRLLLLKDSNCIQLDVEGESPLLVHEIVLHMINKIIQTSMVHNVRCITLLQYPFANSVRGTSGETS
jgi:GTPase SAR1 family protein